MGDEDNSAPAFGDIGGKGEDLFSNGFNYGFYGVNWSTTSEKGHEFSSEIQRDIETNEITGNLSSTIINHKDYGLVVKESWSTDNTLTTDASVEEPFNMENVTVGVENTFQPNTKDLSTTLKSSYVTESMNVETSYDISAKSLNLSSVLAMEGYFVGLQLGYDVGGRQLGDYTLAMGVDNEDITCHAAVTNLDEITGNMYRKVRDGVETGAFMSYSREAGSEFGMAARYRPHEDTVFAGKVNSNAELGLSFQQVLRPGISLTLSALIQSKNFHAGGHKIGAGIELDP